MSVRIDLVSLHENTRLAHRRAPAPRASAGFSSSPIGSGRNRRGSIWARIGHDRERKPRLAQHVALEVHARRDLGDHQARLGLAQHAALGHDGHVLALAPAPAAEGHLLDLGHEFLDLALLPDREPPVVDRHVQPRGREGAAEHQPAAPRRDVDEAAHARGQVRRLASFETLTLPARSICRNDRKAQSNPAPWKKVNRCGEGMMASALSAQPNAKAGDRYAADRPCSIVQGDLAVQVFLEQDARHQGRDPEAERCDVAGGELHRRAPGDHLLDAERLGFQRAEIDPGLAGQRRVVRGLRRLHLVRVDHDHVDQRAGHVDRARRQRTRRRAA